MPKLPITVPVGFRIIAHRGASGYAPENTMSAFLLAERMGATAVELDVRFSRDKQIMVCHDATLDRYGHGGMTLAECTAAELVQLDMGSWFSPYLYRGEKMIMFRDLLSRFGTQLVYHVEIKDDDPLLVEALLAVITEYALQERIVVTSKHLPLLVQMRDLDQDMRIAWLVPHLTEQSIQQAAATGCFQICPRADGVTSESVSAAHEAIPEVRAHHVACIGDVLQAIKADCDGVTINWPDWLVHAQTSFP